MFVVHDMGERHKHMLAVGDDELDVRYDGTMTSWRLLREGYVWKCPVDGQVG
jgi:hypothetical protein